MQNKNAGNNHPQTRITMKAKNMIQVIEQFKKLVRALRNINPERERKVRLIARRYIHNMERATNFFGCGAPVTASGLPVNIEIYTLINWTSHEAEPLYCEKMEMMFGPEYL